MSGPNRPALMAGAVRPGWLHLWVGRLGAANREPAAQP